MFSWCDALGSTPTVGFRLDPHYASTDALISCFSPVLDTLTDENKPLFTSERTEQFAVSFTSREGFQYQADAFKVSVGFVHRVRLRTSDEGRPYSDIISLPLPFNELLPEVAKRAVDAALNLPMPHGRKFDRVGIMSTTTMAFDRAPPGIRSFIKYISKPWETESIDFNVRILGSLDVRADSRDRCFHTLVRQEIAEDDNVTVVLDWQRSFDTSKAVSRANLEEVLNGALTDAASYFEALGEGGRFDD